MTKFFLYIALLAVCWGGWPLVVRSAGDIGFTSSLILMITALIPGMFAAFVYGGIALPSISALVKLCIAGVMMGTGLIVFSHLIPGRDVSTLVPVVSASTLLVVVVGGMYFFSESITPQKILGIVLLIGGIVLLRPI